MTAIKVLRDHDVPEENIFFLNLVSAPTGFYIPCYQLLTLFQFLGLRNVLSSYPKLTIITTAIDEGLNDKKYIVPGIGDFGDRYFGTTY